ncbi:MAG: ATP-dependent RecD-like DNA helicase [Desulfobulbaceae bacterium]|nr:ATP-dependent RecD-like DNA helicase [Desulfobulbaceae bacterium]
MQESNPADTSLRKIKGILEIITFQNDDNGFTVARLQESEKTKGDLTTIVGHLSGVNVGSTLALSGLWVKDSRHGWQFQVKDYIILKPNTLNGMERYLGSGLIKGIGPKFAARIVGTFGLATLDILEEDPDQLKQVTGLGKKRIQRIKKAWHDQKGIHQVMVFLQSHAISAAYAVKIYKKYGVRALAVVKENPYRLAEDIWGIGFRIADRIAKSLGIAVFDERRARAGLLFALNEASNDGHCYLTLEELFRSCHKLLDPDNEYPGQEAVLEKILPQLVTDNRIVLEEDRIYLAPLFFAESGAARNLLAISGQGSLCSDIEVDPALDWAEKRMKIDFAKDQVLALKVALQNRFSIITGGPGTGKSTILKALVLIFSEKGIRTQLAAPTGRAAKRLAEACGREAKTIHRLLEYDPSIQGFKRSSDNPLVGDLIIIDEVSMMDVVLANALFRAVAPGASLLLVGDADQLPSVGPGNILRDCINSAVIPVSRLSRIFRQGQGSLISLNAVRVNQGKFLELLPDYRGEKDFYFIQREETAAIEEEIVGLCRQRLPKKFGFDPFRDIQVLTPMRRGLIGADNLNRRLQDALNPLVSSRIGTGGLFRINDKVMQIRNNYDKDVFNGDLGYVTAVDQEERTLTVDFEGRKVLYEGGDLRELVLAYACTVHKAQGSEFPCVIMPIHTCHYPLLQRNLLYTGMTRGRKLVIIIGTKKALAIAIRNNRVVRRNTRLKERLRF